MNVHQMQVASATRAMRWHNNKPSWSLLEWAGAMAGECGEACNIAKKIKRIDDEMPNFDSHAANPAYIPATSEERQKLVLKMATEVADTILYGMCCFSELGVDGQQILSEVFNKKSEEYGFPERI